MDHSIIAEGFGVRLRPVRMDDAAFIVWLRNLDHVKGRLGDSAADVPGQEAWLASYFKRDGDYYFIVETLAAIPVGTYGIYDVQGTTAESGRWIIRLGVPAAAASGVLLFDVAFGKLGLSELRGTTVATNHPVLSLNRKFGFRQVRIESGGRIIGGKAVDMVHFNMTAEGWSKARDNVIPLARVAEAQIREWEQAAFGTGACGNKKTPN
jgi:RimJ/RimL family protein N-acetyltransferase